MQIQPRQVKDASPLRYPGGKSALTGTLANLIEGADMRRPITYVEPYAGGAGAALSLLRRGIVQRLVINDADPAVYAFWHSCVRSNDEFQTKILDTAVTIQEWARQREIYREKDTGNLFKLGFATFFLNRTNRSGVLNAGVIGGQSQSGQYLIDARFNKQELLDRVRRIGQSSASITVSNEDGINVIRRHVRLRRSFIYADPPYFAKGAFLYKNSFGRADHFRLARLLNAYPEANWVLSYDNVPEIRSLYCERKVFEFDLHYSAHRNGPMRELFIPSHKLARLL